MFRLISNLFQLGFRSGSCTRAPALLMNQTIRITKLFLKLLALIYFGCQLLIRGLLKSSRVNEVRLEVPILREFVTLLINCEAALLVASNALIFQENFLNNYLN